MLNYHTVRVRNNRERVGWASKDYVHPQDVPVGNPDRLGLELIPEILLDVIYTGTEPEVATGIESPSFQRIQADLLGRLQALSDSSPIHHLRCNGMAIEMLLTLTDCLDYPRRSPSFTAEIGLMLYNIPRACLACDVLAILANDEFNHSAIRQIESALHLPSVSGTKSPTPERLLLLGGRLSERDFSLTTLISYLDNTYFLSRQHLTKPRYADVPTQNGRRQGGATQTTGNV
jgi:hypothetical protein